MESTSDYWRGPYFLLEASEHRVWLLNARQVKHVPGRPKTDKLDAVWLAKVTERGMCSPSLVHPKPVRRLRALTRYRRSVVRDRVREQQRLEKLLEDAGIKLSSVVSDLLGVTSRDILEAMIGGCLDPRQLVRVAGNRLKVSDQALREALTGYFEDHHAMMAKTMLQRIDEANNIVAGLDELIDVALAPFLPQLAQLVTIPGVARTAGAEIIAEIGVDMTRFPTAAHLVSWAKFAPLEQSSAGKSKQAKTDKGNGWLGGNLGMIVSGAKRTHTFLGDRYRRIAKHRGKNRAIVAVGNSVLTIIWHLLSDPEHQAVFVDLGEDYYTRHYTPKRHIRDLTRQLERATGQTVTLSPKAA
jgi:transposase